MLPMEDGDRGDQAVPVQCRRTKRCAVLLSSSRLYALVSLVLFAILVAGGLVVYFLHLVAGFSTAVHSSAGAGNSTALGPNAHGYTAVRRGS